MGGIARGGMEAGITQGNHALVALPHQPLAVVSAPVAVAHAQAATNPY